MKRVQLLMLLAASAMTFGCSDTDMQDDNKSPVLEQEQKIHRPGSDIEGEVNPQSPPEKTDPDPGTQTDPDPGTQTDPDPGTQTDPDPGTQTDPDPGTQTDPDPGTQTDPDPGTQTDPDPGTPTEPEPDDDSPIISDVNGVPVLPLTYKPYTTLQIAHRPHIGTLEYSVEHVKALISTHVLQAFQKDQFERYGLGIEDVEGEPWILRENLLKSTDPDISHKGQSLAYFWQISDPQIIDEESPCRMEGVTYAPYVIASAYRPQGIFSTHMFDLHVQTAKRISDLSSRPFDFALVTGDIADNAQENENGWFHRMMEGGVLDPDTGIDDDPIPGPGNDFNDPYYSKGIGNIPWYIAIGNHDLLYMGFSVYDEKVQDACTGDEVVDLFDYIYLVASHMFRDGYRNGFQDGSSPDATVVTSGKTPADPKRRLLSKVEALESFYHSAGLPAGHGLDPDIIAKGWGYYSTYPMPGKPLRLITLDTNSGEFSEANMTSEQFNWLEEQINDAKSKNELVIVQSHHGTDKLSGTVTQSKFQKLLASYPGVILHITGHGHNNGSNVYVQGERGYWEVMLASVVDFPSQTRIFEIVHEGNGIISIYITNLDMNVPKGTFGDMAYNYAAARDFFGMSSDPIADWEREKGDRNLILRTKVPESIYKNLDSYEWPETIESETTLKNLSYRPVN